MVGYTPSDGRNRCNGSPARRRFRVESLPELNLGSRSLPSWGLGPFIGEFENALDTRCVLLFRGACRAARMVASTDHLDSDAHPARPMQFGTWLCPLDSRSQDEYDSENSHAIRGTTCTFESAAVLPASFHPSCTSDAARKKIGVAAGPGPAPLPFRRFGPSSRRSRLQRVHFPALSLGQSGSRTFLGSRPPAVFRLARMIRSEWMQRSGSVWL